MNRTHLLRGLAGLLVVLAIAGIASLTEWVDAEVQTPLRGEAAKNRFYAAQSLLRQLGAQVTRRQGLDAMPPAEAYLLLDSRHWDLFPGRAPRLRQWVEQGGHLVISGGMAEHDQLATWLPVVAEEIEAPSARPRPRRPAPEKDADCRELAQGQAERLRLCAHPSGERYRPRARGQTPAWSLAGEQGAELLRMPLGQGSVTVIGPWQMLDNQHVLRGDNALALATALQLRAGTEVWFVAEEAREPLIAWVWQRGWPAVLLVLLALAAALWRNAVRFGPVAMPAPVHRRSMAEQVRGTAQFLRRHGPAALYGAQLRALQEIARRQLRKYEGLNPAGQAAAIAQATGLDVRLLARALQPGLRRGAALPADLELLETARRRLAAGTAAPAGPAQPSTSP